MSNTYNDLLDVNPRMNYGKSQRGGSKFIDSNNINSGKYKKVKYQYQDLQYNSGNQSTQTPIDEIKQRRGPTAPQVNTNIAIPRPGFASYNNEYLYKK